MKWLYSISTGDSIVRSDSIGGSDDFINIIHLVKLFDLAAYYLRADVDRRERGGNSAANGSTGSVPRDICKVVDW